MKLLKLLKRYWKTRTAMLFIEMKYEAKMRRALKADEKYQKLKQEFEETKRELNKFLQ
jgi:hypothetical protein